MSSHAGRGNFIGTDASVWADRTTNNFDGVWRNKDVEYYTKKSPAPSWAIAGTVWNASGGTITTVGGDTVHTFNSPGTFSAVGGPKGSARVLLVGQGGNGAGAPGRERGSGGGGGVLYSASVTLHPGEYPITVSGNSSGFGITAFAGGGGGLFEGAPGGSGGGGGGFNQGWPGGSAIQGPQTALTQNGAEGSFTGYGNPGGGGQWEGCGGAGGSASFNNDISGSPVAYGNGGGYCTGLPGAGNGGSQSGVVIVRYPTPSPA